jgi:hypothetical protein
MNRQLRANGGIMSPDVGVSRQGYFLGKLVKKFKDDIIPNELKSPAGAAAAAALGSYGLGRMGTGGADRNIFENIIKGGSTALGKIGSGIGTVTDAITKDRFPTPGSKTKTSIGDRLLSGIFGPAGLAIGSGLLAGAFTKDKEDPIYTGQDVGLNLQDIAKLANISDPKTASAIGLRFSPDVESRKFTPAEMAATYAANQERDFTEQREQAQDGGIMGGVDQKDFDKFLEDMKQRDMGAMQDQILRDFKKYMERKKMIEQMPEARDGGIMKMAEGGVMASYGYDDAMSETRQLFMQYKKSGIIPMEMEFEEFLELLQGQKQQQPDRTMAQEGGMMDMGGNEMDLRGGGFVPMGKAERADDVPARLSKNEFVFTADAVRAAGGGNVDKGADKMYATMKKLEDRVA